jgi:hypothetical protein
MDASLQTLGIYFSSPTLFLSGYHITCTEKTKILLQHANTDIFVYMPSSQILQLCTTCFGLHGHTTNQPNMEHEEKYKQKEYQCDCSTEKNTFQTTKTYYISGFELPVIQDLVDMETQKSDKPGRP